LHDAVGKNHDGIVPVGQQLCAYLACDHGSEYQV
jgi:hypothetical protein